MDQTSEFLVKLGFTFFKTENKVNFFRRDFPIIKRILSFKVQMQGSILVAEIKEDDKTEYIAAINVSNGYLDSDKMSEADIIPKIKQLIAKLNEK